MTEAASGRSGEEIQGQIFVNAAGRFQIDTRELEEGDCLQVLIVDGRGNNPRWIDTTIEANGYGYTLSGLLGYSPVGLFARI